MGRDVIVIAGATGRTVSIVTNDLLHEQIKDSAAAKSESGGISRLYQSCG